MTAGDPRTVLIVEDDVDVRDALMETLTDCGYVPVAAANGREALDLLRARTSQPSLILLDIMMPVMDGRQFRAAQLEDPELAAIPVVVLSAHANAADLARQMGACGYLKKPVELGTLISTLRATFDGNAL
jgi:CheY-like chemotaxis protein